MDKSQKKKITIKNGDWKTHPTVPGHLRVFSYNGTNLIVFGVAASGEEVDEEEDEGEDEPGGGHAADDAQALQVQLRLRPEPKNIVF